MKRWNSNLIWVALLGLIFPDSTRAQIFTLSPPSPQNAFHCPQVFREMFKRTPSTVDWDVKLKPSTAVANQLSAPTCDLEAASEVLTAHYRKIGIIEAEAEVSSDFYYATMIQKMIEMRKPLTAWPGTDLNQLESLMQSRGIVSKSAYRLPEIDGKSIRNFNLETLQNMVQRDPKGFSEKYLN